MKRILKAVWPFVPPITALSAVMIGLFLNQHLTYQVQRDAIIMQKQTSLLHEQQDLMERQQKLLNALTANCAADQMRAILQYGPSIASLQSLSEDIEIWQVKQFNESAKRFPVVMSRANK
jgi:hypothetical protein